jgi:hypothetical protein
LLSISLALIASAIPLARRWHEERADRRVALAVEWAEVREFTARLGQSDSELLEDLRQQGVSAVVVSPLTLADLISQGRARSGEPGQADPLMANRLQVSGRGLADQLEQQWTWRGVPGIRRLESGGRVQITRAQGNFLALRDSDAGFDPALVARITQAGMTPILRLSQDPWLAPEHVEDWLESLPAGSPHLGVLFNSDDLPGGTASAPLWRSWLLHRAALNFLPEFKPAASAALIARVVPANTFRAHSIPAAEQKDLKPAQQWARWHRAVNERACRLLLVRMGSSDSRQIFFSGIASLRARLVQEGWNIGFPLARLTWSLPNRLQRSAAPLIAFGVDCLTPALALRWGRDHWPAWRGVFWRIVIGSLVGGLLAAAIAGNAWTRIEVVPFRGVKWGFLIGWMLPLALLYDLSEVRWRLSQHLRRWDLVAGGLAVAVVGYLLVRSGNAPAAWKPGWEQSLRDALERFLIARPRTKEFALGFPLLWAGCQLYTLQLQQRISWDARPLIALGMIGPISMINTFCHLHSPLAIELLRSINGVLIGTALGVLLVALIRRTILSQQQLQLSYLREDGVLADPRNS